MFHVRYLRNKRDICSIYAGFATAISSPSSYLRSNKICISFYTSMYCVSCVFCILLVLIFSFFVILETRGHAQHSGHWYRHGRVSLFLYYVYLLSLLFRLLWLFNVQNFHRHCCTLVFVSTFLHANLRPIFIFPLFYSVVAYTEVRRREASPGGLPSAVSTDRLSSSKV